MNSPDHGVLFRNLFNSLHDKVSPHLALLRSKDCPNLKTLMAKLLGQLMENADVVSDHINCENMNSNLDYSVHPAIL